MKIKKLVSIALAAVCALSMVACGGSEKGAGEAAAEKKTAQVVEFDLTSELYAFGVDKDQPELLDKVNAFVGKIKEDGTLDAICQKYFGDGEPTAITSVARDDSKDQLVVATNAAFAPFEYTQGDSYMGIDMEIAYLLAEELGMELVIEDMAFDSIIPAVQSGKADIGLAGMTVTEDRLENVNFTDTYATATQVIIVAEGSAIQTADDLVGKTIGVQLGTTGDIYASEVEGATIEQYNKGFEAVQALSQGKVDAVIIDVEPAKEFVKEVAGLTILDEEFALEEYAAAIAKENEELLEAVNGALEKIKDSGKLDEIVAKYISAE